MSQQTRTDQGSISIWLVTSSVVMMMLVGLAVDLGGQVHAKQRAHDIAAQAARTGAQQVQSAPAVTGDYLAIDIAAAKNAAREYLSAAHVSGTVKVTDAETLTVEVTDVYTPRFLGAIGIGDLTVTGEGSARLIRTLGGNEQ